MYIEDMSDEELRKLSLKKEANGIATSDALKAQRELWDRAGRPFDGFHHNNILDNNSMFADDDMEDNFEVTSMFDDCVDHQNDVVNKMK